MELCIALHVLLSALAIGQAVAAAGQSAAGVGGVSTKASEFFIGFVWSDGMQSEPQGMSLLVTTDDPGLVRFTVKADNPPLFLSGVARRGEITSLTLPAEVGVMSEGLSDRTKGIRVAAEAEKRISVYGTSSGERATGTFTALPCVDYPLVPRLRYVVLSPPGVQESDILIVGCSNDTSVDITPAASLTIPSDLNPSATLLNAGESASFSVEQLQTVLLRSSDNLSGTLITADQPIAVFTGGGCGISQQCDYVIEQALPHPSWGRTFFTVGVVGGGMIFVSTEEEDETVVNITCTMEGDGSPQNITETIVLNTTEVYNFTTGFEDFCCVEASQPILLLQYGTGSGLDGDDLVLLDNSSGLFLVTIPPLQQYSNNFTVSTPSDTDTVSTLSITVPVQHFDNSTAARDMIRVNDTAASEDWQAIYCSSGDVCAYGTRVSLGGGASTVFHEEPSAGIAAVVYGSSEQGAFSYSAGSSLNPILFPIVSLSASELSVSEGEGNVTVVVIRFGDTSRTTEVELETISLNATVGEDFANGSQTLQFLPGETEIAVVVEILDELLLEPEESFLVSVSVAEETVTVLLGEAEVTIVDDDIFEVGFDSPSYTVDEATGRLSLVMSSNIPNVGIPPIILRFSTVAGSGTATAGEDYLVLETVVRFDTGSREEIVNIEVIDDAIVEGETEVFQVQLEVVTPPTGVVLLQSNASIFIVDVNNVTVFIEPTSVDVPEDGGNVTLTIVKSGETIIPTTIIVTTADESAVAGDDYLPLSLSLTLAPSQSTANISISILPDLSLEDDETLAVVLSVPPGERVRFLPSRSRATVTIRNDDEVCVQFEQERYFVSEGQPVANLTVTKNGSSEVPIEVVFSTQPSDATALQDYRPLTRPIIFTPSTTSRVVGVVIIDDDIVERPERFLALLSISSGSIGVTIRRQTAEVIISDDDAVAVGFNPMNYTVGEGAANVTLRVLKTGTSVRSISVQFFTEDGSATDSDDYVRVNQLLTFGPGGEEVREVGVAILDNALLEGVEVFFGRLLLVTGGVVLVAGGERARVEILDDDEVVVGFSPLSYTVDEGESSVTLRLVKEGRAAIPVAVQYFPEPGTADATDFIFPEPVTVVLGPQQTALEILVLIANDGIIEDTEQFQIRLQVAAGQGGVSLVNDTATVTILDNDMVLVTFNPLQYHVMENAGIAGIRLVKAGEATTSVTVVFSTIDQEAVAPQDYNQTQIEVTFAPTQVEQFVAVAIRDDDTYEATEGFFGVLVPGPEGGVTTLGVVASVLIEDNDAVTIGFNSTISVVREADSNISLTLTKEGTNDIPVFVDITFENGTATAPGDFVLLSRRVEFGPEDLEHPVVVWLQEDGVLENTEFFTISIVQPVGAVGVVIASGRESVTVRIRDSTPGLAVAFDPVEFEVGEGAGFAEFRLVLFGMLERSVNISFTTLDGTATAGEDYNATTRDIVFGAGVGEGLVIVPVRDDSVREEGETFSALITSFDDDVIFRQNRATVSIIDDDGIFVTFDPVAYTVEEGAGEVVLRVRREGESEGDVSVTFNTRDESALGNIVLEDYIPVVDLVVFSPGVTEVNVTIEILDDDTVEQQERFFAMLAIPPGVGGITLGQDEASVIITDDDVVFIGFSSPFFIAPESEPTVSLILERRGQTRIPLTVEFFTSDRSATVSLDYRSRTEVVLFQPPDIQAVAAVTVFDDTLIEGTEEFLGMLRVPPGVTGVVLGRDVTTVEILDDEFAVVSFAQPVYIALESEGSISISLTKEGNTVIAVNVVFRTVGNGTATAGADYQPLDEVVTFLSDETLATVAIPVPADGIVEHIEDFRLVLLSGNETIVEEGEATVRIVDEDEVAIGLEQTEYSVMETQGTVELCSRLMEGLLERSVLVTLSTEIEDDGFFSARSSDFTPLTVELVFDNTTTRLCFNLSIEDDGLYEFDEVINIVLSTDDPNVQLDPGFAEVTIADNEMIVVGFELPSYTFSEEDESAEVCVVVRQGILEESALAFFYSLSEDTATEPADFIGPSPLTFPALGPGDRDRQCLAIVINDDPALEEDSEQFTIELLNSVLFRGVLFMANLPRSTVELNTTTVFIVDNDVVIIGFEQRLYIATEGPEPSIEICVQLISGQLEREAVVTLVTSDESARAPADYAATTVGLTFNPSNAFRCVNIFIEDDDRIEEDAEVFHVNLTASDSDINLAPLTATVIVLDNDGVFGFERDAYSTIEPAGSLEVCAAALDGVLETQLQFALRTANGSALGGEDYVEISPAFEILTLDQRSPRGCANVTILDDQIQEGTEDFMVLLFRISNGDIEKPNISEATVTILDDDVVTVGFNSSSYEVEEGSETATVCLVKEGETNQPFNVTVTHGLDSLEMEDVVLQFSPAVPSICFSLALGSADDDLALEPPETTPLRLTLPPGILPGSIAAAAVAVVDDDAVTVEFTADRYDVMEDSGGVTVCLSKDRRTAQVFSVTIATDNAPEPFSGVVTFNPDAFTSCIVVPVSDNEVALEENQELRLVIAPPTQLPAVLLGARQVAMVVVADNDVVTVELSAGSYEVREDNGTVTVCLRKDRTTALAIPATILPQQLLLPSARESEDFSSDPIPVLIPTQSSMVCISIPVHDDGIFEGPQQFSVTLDISLADPRLRLGATTEANVTIVDNDIVVVSGDDVVTPEEAGTTMVCFNLSLPSEGPLTLPLTFAAPETPSLPAEAGLDFNAPIEMVTFLPGELGACVPVEITSDDLEEGDEQFCVGVVSSDPAVLAPEPCNVTVTILDAGPPSPGICIVEDSITVSPFQARRLEQDRDFSFHGTCEHILVTNCDFDPVHFAITIDFLASNLDMGRVGVRLNERRIIIMENLTLELANLGQPVSSNETAVEYSDGIVIIQEENRTTVYLRNLDIQIHRLRDGDENTLVVNASRMDSPVREVCGLCGTLEGELLFSDRSTTASILDRSQVDQFADSWRVNPGEQFLREQRRECGFLDDDLIIGDPLFTVPLYDQNGTTSRPSSLCYEIHGSTGRTFNLVSDRCTSVNALYSALSVPENGNIISAIGVRAVNRLGRCIDIRVDLNNSCMPTISDGNETIATPRYQSDGVSVARRGQRVRVSVPNCENVQLVMWIVCEEVRGEGMLKFIITRGVNLRPTSHGLLGQFWNVPIFFEPYEYTGTDPDIARYFRLDRLFVISVQPPSGQTRQFVGELYRRTWDKSLEPCYYAGTAQGGAIREFANSPRDTVIEGRYRQYQVQGLFQTEFTYSRFDSSICL